MSEWSGGPLEAGTFPRPASGNINGRSAKSKAPVDAITVIRHNKGFAARGTALGLRKTAALALSAGNKMPGVGMTGGAAF